jgi:ribosomal protein S8
VKTTRQEKLKYAIFVIELNRAIKRKMKFVNLKLFCGLENILQGLAQHGFILGFELIDCTTVRIFFRFTKINGDPVLRPVQLLTKSSLRNYCTLRKLRRLCFYQKSVLPRFFVLSTRQGLSLIEINNFTSLPPKTGGELLFQIN